MRLFRLQTIILLLWFSVSTLYSLAAKKTPRIRSSTNKGFGVPPPTLEEVCRTFRTRLPDDSNVSCPCASGTTYRGCCQPFHLGSKQCLRPLDVLRSRYSAFCYRLVPHVIATTHATNRDYRNDKIAWAKDLNKQGMFDNFEFVGLESGDEIVDGQEVGWIEFTVRLKDRTDGAETRLLEKSRFLRDDQGVWTYASGEVRTDIAGLDDTVLNP